MSLLAGTHLGPYEIVAALGAGGMGEVYRARDARLGREVAIKVLPPEVARDADRRTRFEREARAVAALSHPNILAIHDIGHDGDQLFVVTELLDGETLADRLRSGALPPRKAVEISIAIARGLAAAHGKGIAHRDLKPANVFLLSDGQVKLLDFGLARPASVASPSGATLTQAPLTDPGTVLGTVGYMAPEQIRGQEVDGRADLFALGVVLYEMLTGARAFARETTADTMTAVLKEDPPEFARADLAPALDRIVRHCLEKSPVERFQTARDVIFALESLSGSTAARPSQDASSRRWLAGPRLPWAVAVLAMVGLAGVILARPNATPAASRATFLEIGAPFHRFYQYPVPAISPDGRTVAFWAPDADGAVKLWLRDLHAAHARALPESTITDPNNEGYLLEFSFDGRSLLAHLDAKLKRIPLDGGSPQTIVDAPDPRGFSWGSADVIVYQPTGDGPLFAVPTSGGTPRALAQTQPADDGNGFPRNPSFLPDGRHFLFNDYVAIYVASLDDAKTRLLLNVGSRAVYAQGYLWYVKSGDLMAQPFDAASLTLTGDAKRVAERVGTGPNGWTDGTFSVSPSGVLVYWEGHAASLGELVWLDRSGRRLGVIGNPGRYYALTASTTMSTIGIEEVTQDSWRVRVLDLARDVSVNVTLEQAARTYAVTPVLSRDGRTIWLAGRPGVYQADAMGQAVKMLDPSFGFVADVSPDGRWLLFTKNDPVTSNDLWRLPLAAPGPPEPFLQTREDTPNAKFSRDGNWVAYVQTDGGSIDVFADAFPGKGRRRRVSPSGGTSPMWSGDGRKLYYLSHDFRLMEVAVTPTSSGIEFAPAIEVFQAPEPNAGPNRTRFWPAPDGQRFLYIARLDDAIPRTMQVILNWPALVKR